MKVEYPSNYPVENKPMGAWAYFGFEILYSFPLVGFIVAIIFAIVSRNVHMKSLAKAVIIKKIIIAIIFVLLLLLSIFLSSASSTVSYY